MSKQDSTIPKPGNHHDTAVCQNISRMLARISDKWTLLVVQNLGGGPLRFSALKRKIGDISQKMLASTLRDLEENGFVTRTVTPSTPPQVEYALTGLGYDFWEPVQALSEWTHANSARIDAARAAYAAKRGHTA